MSGAKVCECCDVPRCDPLGGFVCQCADELWCKRCGRCITHCHCAAIPDPEVPWTERLSLAKYELLKMGVVT